MTFWCETICLKKCVCTGEEDSAIRQHPRKCCTMTTLFPPKKEASLVVHHFQPQHSNASLASTSNLFFCCPSKNNRMQQGGRKSREMDFFYLRSAYEGKGVFFWRRPESGAARQREGHGVPHCGSARYLTRVSGFLGACQRQIASIHLTHAHRSKPQSSHHPSLAISILQTQKVHLTNRVLKPAAANEPPIENLQEKKLTEARVPLIKRKKKKGEA